MAGSSHIPVSELIRRGIGLGDVQEGRKSKDEYRKQKDLEEERKLGLQPATVDVETGRDINPHIPEFIVKNPWYVPSKGPTLQHQKPHEERQVQYSAIDDWFKRGPTNKVATKYRKGACENCGSMTHTKKGCFERPRKLGARWTGDDIAPDEYSQPQLTLKWDAKRDRWNGYDPASHRMVVEEYEKLEQTRKLLREEKMKEEQLGSVTSDSEKHEVHEELDDEDKYADDADMAGVTVDMDSRTRITVRNLRIREDTAKYLYNLDPEGPYYDPKSRSMRENPFSNLPGKEKEAAKFSGENFIRYTGEVIEANESQVFAWQARCKGIDVHALAEPTKLEAMKKEFETQKCGAKNEQKDKLLEKYGGGEYLDAPPKELLMVQSDHYIEYDRKGNIIKGEERPAIMSRYEEDRFVNNHTSIFGSYWHAGLWGYACCHSFVKNSYCVGKADIDVKSRNRLSPTHTHHEEKPGISGTQVGSDASNNTEEQEETLSTDESFSSATDSADSDDKHKEKEEQLEMEKRKRDAKRCERRRKKRHRQRNRHHKTHDRKSKKKSKTDEEESDSCTNSEPKKSKELQNAIKKAEEEWQKGTKMLEEGDRKRKYHSNYDIPVLTETEMEAYHITEIHSADPMAQYIAEKRRKQ